MKDWELHKLDKQTFSLEFDTIADFINDLIKGRSSIAHATEVSKSREKKSKDDRKEKARIFAKSTTHAQAKSFKIAVSHERSPKQVDPLVIYNLPTV